MSKGALTKKAGISLEELISNPELLDEGIAPLVFMLNNHYHVMTFGSCAGHVGIISPYLVIKLPESRIPVLYELLSNEFSKQEIETIGKNDEAFTWGDLYIEVNQPLPNYVSFTTFSSKPQNYDELELIRESFGEKVLYIIESILE